MIDKIDAALLGALQAAGRLSIADLARTVSLSHSAVSERLRRLHETGFITGYAATLDPVLLGLPVQALVRVKPHLRSEDGFLAWARGHRQVVACLHVMGEDCFVATIATSSIGELEELLRTMGTYGVTTSSLILSVPVPPRGYRLPTG